MMKKQDHFTVENIDCLEGLKNIDKNSVHLIATDPPYFLDGMGENWNSKMLKSRTKNASSCTSSVFALPASQRFNKQQGLDLYKFIFPIFEECFRVLKPGGFLTCFAQPRLYHRMASAADDVGFEIRDQAIWEHEGGQGKAAKQDHIIDKMKISRAKKELLLKSIAGRKTPQLRPKYESFVIAQKPREGTFVQNWDKHNVGLIDTKTDNGQRTTIYHHNKPRSREEFDHMTIKPVPLMMDIIETFAPSNATIVDPFLGSGTTGEAAIRLGHYFIGFEKDLSHYRTAIKRLSDIVL